MKCLRPLPRLKIIAATHRKDQELFPPFPHSPFPTDMGLKNSTRAWTQALFEGPELPPEEENKPPLSHQRTETPMFYWGKCIALPAPMNAPSARPWRTPCPAVRLLDTGLEDTWKTELVFCIPVRASVSSHTFAFTVRIGKKKKKLSVVIGLMKQAPEAASRILAEVVNTFKTLFLIYNIQQQTSAPKNWG